MEKKRYGTLTFGLSIVAAALALSAALIRYLKHGDVNLSMVAAGIFLLAFGFVARRGAGS